MALLPRARVWATLGLIFTFIILCFPPQVSAAASNQTIDDSETARVRYLPTDNWFLNSECPACLLNYSLFNTSQVGQGTWHDATASDIGTPVNMSFSFTGTLRSQAPQLLPRKC
jgi:hypothetical protein